MDDVCALENVESFSQSSDDFSQQVNIVLHAYHQFLLVNTVDSFTFEELSFNIKELFSKALASELVKQPEIFVIAVLSQKHRNMIKAWLFLVLLLQYFKDLSFYLSCLLGVIAFLLCELFHCYFSPRILFFTQPYQSTTTPRQINKEKLTFQEDQS